MATDNATETMNHTDSYTADQIYRMRAWLARRWNQTIAQVTDTEAIAYLNVERDLERELTEHSATHDESSADTSKCRHV